MESNEAPGAPNGDCSDLGNTTDNNTKSAVENMEETSTKHDSLPYNWDKPEEEKKTVSFKDLFMRNWHPTLVYCGVFWSFGMCVAFLGPTLLDLGCQTSSDMRRISWVFFFQLCFTLIGSVIAGFLVQRFPVFRSNANFVILIACTLIPLFMFTIPFCEVLGALGVVLCLMGLNMGAIDCLANVQMIQLYGDAVSPFLQAMHFCYGVGAFVSPLIAEPFLLNQDCSAFIDNTTATDKDAEHFAEEHATKHIHNRTENLDPLREAQHETEVRFSFWIMCALQIPIPILVASLLYREKMLGFTLSSADETKDHVNGSSPKPAYGTIADKQKGDDKSVRQQDQYRHYRKYKICGTSRSQIWAITACTAILLFIFDGLQSEYGGFIYSYAIKSIVGLNKTEGAYLNAVYWGTFALGRLVAIPVAIIVSSAFMLCCNIIGCSLAMLFMLCLQHDHIALYIGTFVFGLFLSSSTPTALSLAEQYIDISSIITTIVVVAAALGDMLSPVIVGNIFVSVGPKSFLQFGLAFCLISIFVYGVMLAVGSQTPKHLAKGSSSFVWYRLCCARNIEAPDEPPTHVKYYTRMSESDSTIELGNISGESSEQHHS